MPLRFSRPVMALIATGTAAICVGLCTMPASADQVRDQEWWLGSLHITAAWAASQGSGATVAVLSDGVAAGSADLTGAVTAAPAPPGAPVASGQYVGEVGTPIASLIAGRGHGPSRGAGIVGVAPKARILSISVTLPADDPRLAQASVAAGIPGAIAAGIRYAVSHGATVIDLPIDPGQAGSTSTGASAASGGSAAEHDAVNFALAHNVVLVAPAGDDQTKRDAPNYPAAYRGVIAVGAFNSAFNKPAWSSHQGYVTLTAAGAGVMAADNSGGYQAMNSTSAASAVVSGVVALIRARYPSLTAAEVRQALITTTSYHRGGKLANGSGYGAVNAGRAMTAAAALAAPPGRRAGGGALPRNAPAAAPTPASSQSLGAQILRAAETSGAVLLFLLLLIAAYVAIGRRRPRSQPALATEWTHRHGQSRYPHAGGSDADRMLELFAAPAPPPAPSPALGSARDERYGAHAGGGGRPAGGLGLFAAGASRALGGQGGSSARQSGGPVAGEPTVAGGSDGAWLSHSPASRAVSRRASVSGAPPWEPASAPDGDLPWAAVPGRPAGAPPGDVAARQAPASDEAAWEAPAHVVPGEGPASVEPPLAAYSADLDDGSVGRAGRFDRELTAREFSSPAGATGPYPSPSFGAGLRASPPASAGYRSPTGSGAPVDFDAAPDYTFSFGKSSPADYGYDSGAATGGDVSYGSSGNLDRGSEFDAPPAPRLAPSGLPVREPRASRPPGSAPLSPSGSLWEPPSRDASPASESAGNQDQAYDAAGRPIFVWDPAKDRE